MLELINIKKVYAEGENAVRALRGINLKFRKSDFVSILGPSGCGKTTMLNIIGGLDQYTEGDLVIDGRSTKDFKDRDWDAYRNHSIGFVFQSYNLIPHQTVLQNVELALTLSGVDKEERRARAAKALEQVGLKDQLKKRPSELSGGQMQRVAIARALVNNPDIILADEPTGALDTETSVQVMDILKEISKDRLVIMVTHNPELAEKYSTRIIRMLDGSITDDSAPLTEDEEKTFREQDKKDLSNPELQKAKSKMPSMSLATAFGLSLKNLFTKKGRTTLTAFAGSIGIIGIALIFAVSEGAKGFINSVQEDTLTSYPLTIEAATIDMGTLMETFLGKEAENKDHPKDKVYSQPIMLDMINSLNNLETRENDLASFKKYIEAEMAKEDSRLSDALSGIKYTYDLDLLVYTKNVDGKIVQSDSEKLMIDAIKTYMGIDMGAMSDMQQSSPMGSLMGGGSMTRDAWVEMLAGKDGSLVSPVLQDQYDVIYGSWPNSYDEIVLVVNQNNEVDDLTLYALGLRSYDEVEKAFNAVLKGTELDAKLESWTYEEICDTTFRVVLNSDCYVLDEATGLYKDIRIDEDGKENEKGLRVLYDKGLNLKVSGIIRPSEKATSSMLTGSIAYTQKLTEYVIEKAADSPAIKAQMSNKTTDVITGLPFAPEEKLDNKGKAEAFKAYIDSLDTKGKAEAYIEIKSILSDAELNRQVDAILSGMTREDIIAEITKAYAQQPGVSVDQLLAQISQLSDEELFEYIRPEISKGIESNYAHKVQAEMSAIPAEQLAQALTAEMAVFTEEQSAVYYDEILEFSKNTYDRNLITLGALDLDSPATVNLFASSFENKDIIEEVIADYNRSVEELKQIKYTDYIGLMMSSITTIIDAITYILGAFVGISLVVSSIMIGVITLISVQERTKEIGILRAIGASKSNVSSMFNAETVIIGFAAGLIGVIVTALLCLPINAIIYMLTDIPGITAYLPVGAAVILVLISVVLTLISGIIPSRSAAKKDPVVALRTE